MLHTTFGPEVVNKQHAYINLNLLIILTSHEIILPAHDFADYYQVTQAVCSLPQTWRYQWRSTHGSVLSASPVDYVAPQRMM